MYVMAHNSIKSSFILKASTDSLLPGQWTWVYLTCRPSTLQSQIFPKCTYPTLQANQPSGWTSSHQKSLHEALFSATVSVTGYNVCLEWLFPTCTYSNALYISKCSFPWRLFLWTVGNKTTIWAEALVLIHVPPCEPHPQVHIKNICAF